MPMCVSFSSVSSVCLFVCCPSVCQSLCPSVCPSVHLCKRQFMKIGSHQSLRICFRFSRRFASWTIWLVSLPLMWKKNMTISTRAQTSRTRILRWSRYCLCPSVHVVFYVSVYSLCLCVCLSIRLSGYSIRLAFFILI